MSTVANGTQLSKRPATPLARLADDINAAHDAATAATEYTVGKWAAVGELLLKAKEEAGHGNFGAWVESSCKFGTRQAQKYMRVHERRAEIEAKIKDDPDAVFGVDDATAAVAAPMPPTQMRIRNSHLPATPAPATPAPATGQTRVNGVLQDDPPDVAARRAAGRIPEGVVVDVTTHEPPDAATEPEPEAEPEVSDEEWLASLPLHGRLSGGQAKVFEADALAYRHMESARRAYKHALSRLPRTKKKGPWRWSQDMAMSKEDPTRWIACPAPEHGGCGGQGIMPLGPCPKCRGNGFIIP
jgi:hypothetical protein